ncbi:MAG: hypothetical protein HWE23_09590 [Rhodobacteraceae bacterium]|nr:hypothetical protein [Paracoccaceae bacterium]
MRTIKAWIVRHHNRQILKTQLLEEPGSVLADAGFTQDQLFEEIKKPFWKS